MKTLLLLAAFMTTLLSARAEPNSEMNADFEWFGKLGFADVKALPFTRYCYGTGFYAGGRREEQWANGFLIDDTPDKFRILSFQFQTLEYQKTDHNFDANYRHENADLRAFVEEELRPPDPQDRAFARHRLISGPHFSERTRLFALGWMCARKGLDDLAGRLYAAAQTAAGVNPGGKRDETGWTFRFKLERDIGHVEMWRTIVAFGDPKITRRELLVSLRALAEQFPHCDHLTRAASTAKQLEQMIAEDDTHAPRSAEVIAALPPAQQVEEWIFRLRDQNGTQFSQPGWVDIFMTPGSMIPGGKGDSPAHQLVKHGDAAVPALIAAVGDARLTRSVGYGRNFNFSHEVITVGDAALKIIERIAGREFYRSGSVQGTMVRDGNTDLVRTAVQAWWKERQAKGEMGELAEMTARGGFSSARAGATLLAKFPNEAATPILVGAAAVNSEGERCEFVRLVGKLKDVRAVKFLLQEAKEGPLTGPRAEAAWQLAKAGRTDGIAPLAELWRSTAPSSKSSDGRGKLIMVLAMADTPEGIRALGDGLRGRSLEARRHVIEALGKDRTFLLMRLGDYDRANTAPDSSAATVTAIEDLLAAELEDTGSYSGMSGFRDGKQIDHPRLCDEAASVLAGRWPDRYAFDPGASYPLRERQRMTCLNVWRKARDLPVLPLPPERPRAAAGDEGKIAEVVFAGDGIKWPESVIAALRAARGQVMDAALFRGIEKAFLDACDDKKPAGDLGFFVEAFRENSTDGVTLIAAPAPRHGLAARPERDWRIEYHATFGERERLDSIRVGLFGNHPVDSDHGKFDEIMSKIAALPGESPFHLHMELAPTLWDVDNAF